MDETKIAQREFELINPSKRKTNDQLRMKINQYIRKIDESQVNF